MQRLLIGFVVLLFGSSTHCAEKWLPLIVYGKSASDSGFNWVSLGMNSNGKVYVFEEPVKHQLGLSWHITVQPNAQEDCNALAIKLFNEKSNGAKKQIAWLDIGTSSYYPNALCLNLVYVEKKYRGQGCARLLLDKAMFLISKKTEWKCIYLEAFFKCWTMYRKWGFELTKNGRKDLLASDINSKSLIEMVCDISS